MAMNEGIHLCNTAFHLNICPDLRCGDITYVFFLILLSMQAAECFYFYALSCYMSATVCNITTPIQYIVANLHYACHILE